MNRLLPKGLAGRFFVLGLCFIVIPLTFIFSLAIHSSKETLEQQTKVHMTQATTVLANTTKQLFEQKLGLLEVMTQQQRDGDYPDHADIDMMNQLTITDPFFHQIAYLNHNGTIRHITPFVTTNYNIIREQANEVMWRRNSFVSIVPDRDSTAVMITVPFQEEEHGEITGSLIATVNLEHLTSFLEETMIGNEGRSLLVSHSGHVFIDTKNSRLSGTSLFNESFFSDIYTEKTGIHEDASFANIDSLIAYRPIDHLPVFALSIQPVEQAFAPISALSSVLTKGWVFIFIAGISVLTLSMRWIIKPIKQLTDQATFYAKGEKWKIDILKEKDEIQTLGKAMKHMADELKQKERYLQLILESFPYGVMTTDPRGEITSLNKAGEKLVHTQKDKLIGKSISALPSQKLRQFLQQFKDKTERFTELEEEISSINAEGKKQILKVSIFPLLDEQENFIGVLITFWDITKIKQLESHLQRSEHLAAIGQMTAGLAHEIKNPLGTIQLATDVVDAELKDLIKKEQLTTPTLALIEEALSDISDETRRMNELVSRFLKLSRQHKKEEKQFDVNTVVNEVIQLLSHQCNYYQIEVSHHLESKPCVMIGDRNQLIQALLNLFLNGIEAMKQSGGILTVTTERREENVELIIQDEGIGIERSKLKRIFNPFFSTKQEGTGLGLSITHDIITQHKGHIEVESDKGVGTTFTIILPSPIENH
ncbi:ATP-binding protein [Desertibacillus haloalkaliphilus]|uniref:ATP-binding protein n=1 Tax=Desertibacillus haloalkaliphilus TaxID=1328930 RepID=UPI001C27543B|nr:ATP-binding protein [Desertibacillus haloalkaliphilus]MBU8908371.1 PAS domain S-box protein [Desertibacillus haloalkaliphilus]